MTLTTILLSINIIVCLFLIGAVLIQKSEGGALGMGGGPSNFMSARGTGDLLTRITWILFGVFLAISITLTLLAAAARGPDSLGKGLTIDPSKALEQKAPSGPAPLEAPAPDVTLPSAPAAPIILPAEQAPEKK